MIDYEKIILWCLIAFCLLIIVTKNINSTADENARFAELMMNSKTPIETACGYYMNHSYVGDNSLEICKEAIK